MARYVPPRSSEPTTDSLEEAGGDLTDTTVLIVTPTLPIETALPVSQSSAAPVVTPTGIPIQTSLPPVNSPSNTLIRPIETLPTGPPSAINLPADSPSSAVIPPIESQGSSPTNDAPASQPAGSSVAASKRFSEPHFPDLDVYELCDIRISQLSIG